MPLKPPDSGQEIEIRIPFHSSYFWGLYTPSPADLSAAGCRGRVLSVETRHSVRNVGATILTLGLFTPLEVRAVCSMSGVTQGDDDMEIDAVAIIAHAQRVGALSAIAAGCDSLQLEQWIFQPDLAVPEKIMRAIEMEAERAKPMFRTLCLNPPPAMARIVAAAEQERALAADLPEAFVPSPVFFDFGSSIVPVKELEKIKTIAEKLRRIEVPFSLVLKGFTDEAGEAVDNLILAERRLESVRTNLLRHNRELTDRIHVQPIGELREFQLYPGAIRNEPGAQYNRRVTITLEIPGGEIER